MRARVIQLPNGNAVRADQISCIELLQGRHPAEVSKIIIWLLVPQYGEQVALTIPCSTKASAFEGRNRLVNEWMAALAQPLDEQLDAVDALEQLGVEPGESVQLLCYQEHGPARGSYSVIVMAAWTEWHTQGFEGETLMQALQAAMMAKGKALAAALDAQAKQHGIPSAQTQAA